MQLEGLAEAFGDLAPEPGLIDWTPQGDPDLTPLVIALAIEPVAARGAARFHATLTWALSQWVLRHARALDLKVVAASGGCLLNAIVSRGLAATLHAAGLTLWQAEAVPPNDGGLALGQAWVARCAHA
jgi:hydrogenase maturation protein HypF